MMIDLLNEGAVQLMPGVERLLLALKEANIPRSVVTHSAIELINIIRKQHKIFDTIPVWITREQYSKPKPDPECYIKTISMLAKSEDKVIGFEDTPRGLISMMGSNAKPVLISQIMYPEIPDFINAGVTYYPSFEAIPDDKV
jgi:beta-phosphoglucomutase